MNFEDKITVKGQVYSTISQPLKEFETEIQETLVSANFVIQGFDREYIAFWEIDNLQLYLTDIKVLQDDRLQSVFPPSSGLIFANWFSGEIVLEKDKSYISNFFKNHKFKKTHHYIFKEGKQTAFYPIDEITERDDEDPF